MRNALAVNGGKPLITIPEPHFKWPPAIPGLAEKVAGYISAGHPLSIQGRSGIYAELEDRLCELHNRKHALLVSSGTMGLYSAFFALDLKPGDEVISTVYSFHATASPLLHFGVRIAFCDVEADTGNIDVQSIDEHITPRTKAIVTNHMWGHPVNVSALRSICEKHKIAWVEDCSHAHFAAYNGRFVGGFGDASVFSLQGNKLVTGGEGGVLLTDSTEIYERATLLGHSLARSEKCVKDTKWKGILRTGFGLKLRIHPLAALMVKEILDHHCFEWIENRRRTLARFSRGLVQTGCIKPMARRDYVTSMGAHYGFKPRLDLNRLAGVSRERLVRALRAEGVAVAIPGSPPFHRLPLFVSPEIRIGAFEKHAPRSLHFPGAEQYTSTIISLPTFTFAEQRPIVDMYVEAFHKVLSRTAEIP